MSRNSSTHFEDSNERNIDMAKIRSDRPDIAEEIDGIVPICNEIITYWRPIEKIVTRID